MRADLIRKLEPWAPPPEVRIEVMRRLAEAGIAVGLSVSPVLPGLTDDEAGLDELLERAAAAGVRRLASQMLFLRSPTREKYFRFLEAEFPRYLEAYRAAYADRVFLGGRYRERMRDLVKRLRRKHGFTNAFERQSQAPPPRRPPAQLPLWA
jgi:DNA repair photolyase